MVRLFHFSRVVTSMTHRRGVSAGVIPSPDYFPPADLKKKQRHLAAFVLNQTRAGNQTFTVV